ncbi:MATE family efflux transporter [Streptomyces sp. NPDC059262]|uniref:MATE family efflux transporter n=1 Tax=Streptomyces sp. NPDC059262 TaxID=3346797 RepID=UPI00368A8872
MGRCRRGRPAWTDVRATGHCPGHLYGERADRPRGRPGARRRHRDRGGVHRRGDSGSDRPGHGPGAAAPHRAVASAGRPDLVARGVHGPAPRRRAHRHVLSRDLGVQPRGHRSPRELWGERRGRVHGRFHAAERGAAAGHGPGVLGTATAITINQQRGAAEWRRIRASMRGDIEVTGMTYVVVEVLAWSVHDPLARLIGGDAGVAAAAGSYLGAVAPTYAAQGAVLASLTVMEETGGGFRGIVLNASYFGLIVAVSAAAAHAVGSADGFYAAVAYCNLIGVTVPLIAARHIRNCRPAATLRQLPRRAESQREPDVGSVSFLGVVGRCRVTRAGGALGRGRPPPAPRGPGPRGAASAGR